MEETDKLLRRNIIWNSIGSTILLACQWLTTIVIVRLGNYEKAGILTLSITITTVFYCLAVYGVRNFQVSDINKKYEDNIYIITRLLTCLAALILCTGFVLLNHYNKEQTFCIIIYMVFRVAEAYVDVYHGFDQRADRMDIIGKSCMIRGILNIFLFTITLIYTHSLLLSIIVMTFGTIVIIYIYDKFQVKKFVTKTSVDFHKIINLILECLPLALVGFISSLILFLPKYFLEFYYGNTSMGIYSSIAMPTLIVQTAATYIFNPLITKITYYYKNRMLNQYNRLIKNCFLLIGILCMTALLGGIFFGKIGLKLLYGESILPYSYLLLPLIICTILTATIWFFSILLTIMRELKAILYSNIFTFIVCILLSPIIVKKWEMNGVNYITMLSLFIQVVIMFILCKIKSERYFKNEI